VNGHERGCERGVVLVDYAAAQHEFGMAERNGNDRDREPALGPHG
jgi:hypothetical protein